MNRMALTATLIPAWLALACDGTTAPTESLSARETELDFNFSNGPPVSGNVFRFSISEGFFFTGGDLEQTILIYFSPENGLLNSLLERCTPTTANAPLDFHWVETGDIVRLMMQDKEAFTFVFEPEPSWFNPDPPTCQDLLDNLIASGQSHFQYNDNDWIGTGSATNVVSMKSHGVLEDLLNGGETRLQMTLHWQWMDDFTTLRFLQMRAVLSPDPRRAEVPTAERRDGQSWIRPSEASSRFSARAAFSTRGRSFGSTSCHPSRALR